MNLKTGVSVSLAASLCQFFFDVGLWVAASHHRCVVGDSGFVRPGSLGLPSADARRGVLKACEGECLLPTGIMHFSRGAVRCRDLDWILEAKGFLLAALQVVATVAIGVEPRARHER